MRLKHLPKLLMYVEAATLFLSNGSFFVAVLSRASHHGPERSTRLVDVPES